MSLSATRRHRQGINYWPGFVDGLAALLVVVIFLVMIFVLAQLFLSEALSGRDEALERLTRQIDQLASLLDLERTSNADLRVTVAQLSAELQSSIATREEISGELTDALAGRDLLIDERDALAARLAALEQDLQAAEAAAESTAASVETMRAELEDAFGVIDADKEKIALQLRDLERLTRDIAALQSLREKLEQRVTELAAALDVSQEDLDDAEARVGNLRDTTRELEARLADEEERTLLAQRELEARDIRLRELLSRAETAETSFSEESAISDDRLRQIEILNRNITALRRQLAAIEEALEISEERNDEQQAVIANLGQRLNAALATKVAELARYRSVFFGRLREKLGQRRDVRIEGDRFVFQSEVLFASGQAELRDEGLRELVRLASTLKEISADIPAEIDWVLRIDGHTDAQPIATARFPSNWELSSARAIAVVKFMIEQGVTPERLLAAGFGEFHPLDPAFDEVAFRRNRRIEFKLTQR